MNAIIHAIAHWPKTVAIAALLPPISRLTVAIAAIHGVYNRVNTKNTNAVNGVNSVFSPDMSPPSRTVRVDTTLSFAVNPVISAVETRQSPNPRGLKIGAINPPICASILESGLSAILNFKSKV